MRYDNLRCSWYFILLLLFFLTTILLPAKAAEIPPSPFDLNNREMIEKGHKLFNQTCGGNFCHAPDGRKGTRAPGFQGRDDLTVELVYTTIMNGRPRTPMRSFKDLLSQEEIWQAIAFIMSLQASKDDTQQPSEPSRVEEAIQNRTLYLCVSPNYLPYSYQDPFMPGFEVEIGNELAKVLGLKVIIQYNFAFRNRDLYNCDIFMGVVQSKKKDGSPRFFHTKPYYGTGYLLVLTKEIATNKNQKVGVESGSLAHHFISQKGLPVAPYTGQAEIIKGIINREIQGGLVEAVTVGWYLKQHPDAPIQSPEGSIPEPELRWNVVMDVNKAHKDLEGAINMAIDQLTQNQTILSIMDKYGVPYYAPFSETMRDID